MSDPMIIQGGMGVGISNWRLANAVSRLGALGVVSGTALDQVFARRLQDGDPGRHMRRGLEQFPFREIAERVWGSYYIPGGKSKNASYQKLPMHDKEDHRALRELCIVANFVEVFLAREDHGNQGVCRGQWRVVDATLLAPRQSLARITTGRDAANTAFLDNHEGAITLNKLVVTAVVDGDLPQDSIDQLLSIR